MTRSSCRRAGRRRWPSYRRAEGSHQSPGQGVPRAPRGGRRRWTTRIVTSGYPTQGSLAPAPTFLPWTRTTVPGPAVDRQILRNTRGFFEGRSKIMVAVLGLAFIGVVCVLDYLTGPSLSLSLLYLMPIGLVTWNLGRRWGAVSVVVATIVGIVADVLSSPQTNQLGPGAVLERHRAVRRVPGLRDAARHAAVDHRRAVGARGTRVRALQRPARDERGEGHAAARGLARPQGTARRHPGRHADDPPRRRPAPHRRRARELAPGDRAERQQDEPAHRRPAGPGPHRPRQGAAQASGHRRRRAGQAVVEESSSWKATRCGSRPTACWWTWIRARSSG